MLQIIRERLTGWVAVVILGLVALTLVLTFGAIDTGFTAAGAAATVNGEDIPVQDFRRIYQRQRQEWERNYRAQIPDALAEDIANQVVQTLVRNRVIVQHVRDQGYRVSNDEVYAVIQATPAFHVGGRFSQPAYEQLLAAEGMNPQRYEYEQRQEMQIAQFIEGLGYTAFYTPAEFRRYVELDGEARDIDYVLLQAESWANDVEITEEQISASYELNQAAYMTEESVALEYVEVSYADILATVTVSDDEAREYYEANPQEFAEPEERQARHILIPVGDDEAVAEQLAADVRSRLVEGEGFDALAAQYSADMGSAANGGDLGWLGSGDSPSQEFEDAMFLLSVDELSEPVRTEFGFHLIRLDGLRSGTEKSLDEVKSDLIEQLSESAAADLFVERVDELDDLALESLEGLAPVADVMGLELGVVDSYTRGGTESLGFSPDLISAVFSLEVLEDGENSPVIDLGEGRALVVRVTEHRLAEVRPLEDVREAIMESLRGEESIWLVAQEGNRVLTQLNDGIDVQSVALSVGAQWQQVAGARRGAQELPVDLAAELFRVAKPDSVPGMAFHGLVLASGNFAIFRVTAVTPGTPESYSRDARDVRKQQLAGRLGGSQATALVQELVGDASINVANDLLGTDGNTLQ
jgi:peptidyl-prolyl cis-trans isomerase D